MSHKETQWSPQVKCPFYKADKSGDRSITCEGVFDRSICVHRFRRQQEREKQLTLFCTKNYKTCEIYRAVIEARYPED